MATLIPKFETSFFDDFGLVNVLFLDKSINPIEFKLETSRVSFGFVIISNKFCHVHYKYIDIDTNSEPISKPHLVVDIYGLDLLNGLIHETKHKIECGYTCGNVNGKIMQIDNTKCRIILGDLCNYNEVRVIDFTLTSIQEIFTYDWSVIDYDFDEVYFLNINLILRSDVIGFDTNCIGIRIINLSNQNIFGKEIIFKSNCSHKYTDKPNELESSIIQVLNDKYILIKIKLINSINILKTVEEYILVLVDIIEGEICSLQKFNSKLEYGYTIDLNSTPQIDFLKLTS